MRAVLYNTRIIYAVPHGPSGCAKGALRAQNILSAVIFNSTCKIKIKSHGLTMWAALTSVRSIRTVPTGRVAVLKGLRELTTY